MILKVFLIDQELILEVNIFKYKSIKHKLLEKENKLWNIRITIRIEWFKQKIQFKKHE